jgi:hypothetical protein
VTGLVIGARFNGPPTTGNGGFTAGRLAAGFAYGRTVRVTLRHPPPLDVPMSVTGSTMDGLRLLDADRLIAEAVAVDPSELGAAVPAVGADTAEEAMQRFDGGTAHPFPTCFVCGPQRHSDDGLGLYAGAIDPTDPSRTATVFVPRTDLTQDVVGTGPAAIIGPEIVWAALDCPGGWTLGLPGRPAVLGRMTAEVKAMPAVGERCVVVGQLDGRDGRKGFTRATAYGADGRELGRARAVWIEIGNNAPLA